MFMKTAIKVAVLMLLGGWNGKADFIVAPNDRATQSGNTFVSAGFDSPTTFQMVYGSKSFSAPVMITSLAFRLDETKLGLSFEAVIPNLTIQLSTYPGTLASFNRFSYLANMGADNKTVYDSSVHWTTTDLAGSGPNPFDLQLSFTQPFIYDPSMGALLMNFTATGTLSSGVSVDAHASDSATGWIATADGIGGAIIVTRFDITPIPEPSTIWLL